MSHQNGTITLSDVSHPVQDSFKSLSDVLDRIDDVVRRGRRDRNAMRRIAATYDVPGSDYVIERIVNATVSSVEDITSKHYA